MQRIKLSLVTLACIGLLSVQLSGLHMHVGATGDPIDTHGIHLHESDPDGEDHSADSDVSVIEEFGSTWTKLLPLLFAAVIMLSSMGWIQVASRPTPQALAIRRVHHWRPPLRAPPISQ
jgi:hypothetical protein